MRNGGFLYDSKFEIYQTIPQKYYPRTILIEENKSFNDVLSLLNENNFSFPLFLKPDVGLRGSAVEKVHTIEQLENYFNKVTFSFLIQETIPYANEVGIFYVKLPNKEGKITGIVEKEFLTVTGDGVSNIKELIKKNLRYAIYYDSLEKSLGKIMTEIIEKDAKKVLVPYGNHARGSKFIDSSFKKTSVLEKTIVNLCKEIDGFYFGRIDLMFNTWEELEKGKNFSIIEVNGAASEPTHIYDPKHSLLFAWKELAKHICMLDKICTHNKKMYHLDYLTFKEGIKQYKLHFAEVKKLKSVYN